MCGCNNVDSRLSAATIEELTTLNVSYAGRLWPSVPAPPLNVLPRMSFNTGLVECKSYGLYAESLEVQINVIR